MCNYDENFETVTRFVLINYLQINFYQKTRILRLMLSSTPSPSKLSRGSSLSQKVVYKLTKNTVMKFRPEPSEDFTASPTLMDRLKSLSRTRIFSKQQGQNSKGEQVPPSSASGKNSSTAQPLKFLFKLDNDSYVIGNKIQLDAFSITMIEDYLETEQLWVFKAKQPILHLHVDSHRKTLIAIVEGQIRIYSYEGKKSRIPPVFQKAIKFFDEIKVLQMAKDSLLAVLNNQSIDFFTIDGPSSRQVIRKQLGVAKQFQLFQLAPCIDNVLNVFFSRPKGEQNFEVWGLQVEIQGFGAQVHELKKVYDIQNQYYHTLRIESISRDCYLLNIGQAILMFKKGYLVDRVYINIHVEGSYMKYLDKQLIHAVPSQIDFYGLQAYLNSNPPKLTITSEDSVQAIPENSQYTFLDALKFDQHRIGFFYQLPANGQVKYYLTLTQQWDFDQKVNSILPKVSQYKPEDYKELIKRIEQCCATVNKMGVSRKQAYLRIWKQSNKQSVEEFKLLLDTMDYDTIRNQILLKLKKKSMTFIEVYKIEQGCLGMLSESYFSSKIFSADEFKNYLLSHFLIRKLQLFKQLKLYAKSSGKIKQEQGDKSKDKLMITVQEYTNFVNMDLKQYLLQLIYTYCKFRKDISTQIRIVIRKFKFAFRYIYYELLADIVATAKQDLYFLLQSIPEILAYTQSTDSEDSSLYEGVWGKVKPEEWEQSLYLTNVVTVYNRQMVIEASKAVWIKRNWLTSHDMIFLNRQELQSEYAKVRGENLFYSLIEHIFTHFTQQQLIEQMVSFLQVKYTEFPKHLLNNIMLYRNLYLYFVSNQVMGEPFQLFLRRTDEQIFKKIFDHQKFKKGSFLKEVKPIFENLKQSNKFNYGLLKYFSSTLSQVSDIKYLLNRINNEKREFHAENEEMYEVLMKGMQIKLKLGSQKDIPISQVLIYIENIPFGDDNAIAKQLKTLQRINEEADKFKRMKINMSIFEMIRNRDSVLYNSISFQIEQSGILQANDAETIVSLSRTVLKTINEIRIKIYGPFQDNIILFIFLTKLLETTQLIPHIPSIVQDATSFFSEYSQFDLGWLQSAVFYCYRKKVANLPKYVENQSYILELINILPEDNFLRQFVSAQIELASLFSTETKAITFPISGSTGVISKIQLQGMIQNLPISALKQLNLQRVCELSTNMYKIVKRQQPPFRIYELYQIAINNLLAARELKGAISLMQVLVALQPDNLSNIVFPLFVFRAVSFQLTDENKLLLSNIICYLFKQPVQLINVFKSLISKSFSNDEQRQLLSQKLANSMQIGSSFSSNNILFDESIGQYLQQFPDKKANIATLLNSQYTHILRSKQELSKSIDVLIYHIIIIQQPSVLINYIALNMFQVNLKQLRTFLSYLTKYDTYDCFKVLEFGKRVFKAIYDQVVSSTSIELLIAQIFETPLSDITNIDVLSASTVNLQKIVKSIERFKAKLKAKLSASKRKIALGPQLNAKELKFIRIQKNLQDVNNLPIAAEYPFFDSDEDMERKEYLIFQSTRQQQAQSFDQRKYLTWLFCRTNQPIEYYLLRQNQNEADEEIKKQEEALKLSFRKAPKENPKSIQSPLKPKSNINQEKLTSSPVSQIPFGGSSDILVNPTWAEEIDQRFVGATLLKDQIIASVAFTEDHLTYDYKLIKAYEPQQLENLLPEVLRQIYKDQKLQFSTNLELIRQIYRSHTKTVYVNEQFLDVYAKIQQLQKKILGLNSRVLLPFQGLLTNDKDNSLLFARLKQSICPYLNQNNIHTVSKIISMAFKNSQFQHQLSSQFLKLTIREYNQLENPFDSNLKLMTITAFSAKISASQIKNIDLEKIIGEISNQQKRGKIVKILADTLRQKNQLKIADHLQQKFTMATESIE